jgi:glyoxalase superfamily protein
MEPLALRRVKNRLHLDLNPGDGTLAAELERLTALGATVLARHSRGSDLGWVVLADPEGNEFCVESSDAEVAGFEERLAEDDAFEEQPDAEDDARLQDPPATSP